jgi:Tfp pilus assembly protein PilV
MKNIKKQQGFSAVELLITLFIAAAFLISGFQLYAVVLKDGGEARMSARAANAATEYLQQYKSNVAVENPCESSNPLTDSPVTVTGLSNTTVSVSITCPYATASPTADECTGGDSVTYDGLYTVRKFTNSSTPGTLACPIATNAKVLIVGGGGGGGSYVGGGGGGGGFYEGDTSLIPGSYTITVGAGGTGGTGGGSANNANGSNSSIVGSTVNLVALGGGTGSRYPNGTGAAGGSGGGAGGCEAGGGLGGAAQQPTFANGGFGFRGGNMSGTRSGNDTEGRGGGGAGSAGTDTSCGEPGDGGNGSQSSITGTNYYYAGGGGGGAYYGGSLGDTRSGNGGLGGGGGGGAFTNGAVGAGGTGGTVVGETPTLNMGTLGQGVGGAGGTNTGSGGGGCGHLDKGGNGGSGVVIVRYLTPTAATNATSKITATLKYGSPQQSVTNSTYVGFSPIVTNGLVLNLDAANSASYPGTGTTWFDLSGNGNNGTLMNSPVYSATNGGYLSFDGIDDYVNSGNNSSLMPTTAVTFAAWIKPSASSNYRTILSKGYDTTDGGYALRMTRDSEPIKLFSQVYNSSNSIASSGLYNNIAINNWYYVVGTYDGTNVRLFINGVQSEVTGSLTGNIKTNTLPVKIGMISSASSTSEYYTGLISSVSIYNRALSASEITQNFNALRGRYGL